jgi:sterol desaturase/sphingolipid hydroxylase (fatty acid hydroxylase superfamily)
MSDVIRELQLLPPFVLNVVKLCIWLVLLSIVFIPLERLFALRRQEISRKSFWTDLTYYFLNSLLPNFILIFPLSLVAWAAHHFVPYRLHEAVQLMPLWARLTAALVIGEIGFYWGHRWSHEIPLLWRFHAVHHSAEEIDWLVNTRAHPFDMVFTRLCGFAPLYLLGLMQGGGASADLAPILIVLIGAVWGFFIHANLRWRFGPVEWVISTPGFHHWHHTNDEHRDMNFAPVFPWVDRLFGTLHLPGREWPVVYGIDAPISENMAGQLLDPLLPASRAAAPST